MISKKLEKLNAKWISKSTLVSAVRHHYIMLANERWIYHSGRTRPAVLMGLPRLDLEVHVNSLKRDRIVFEINVIYQADQFHRFWSNRFGRIFGIIDLAIFNQEHRSVKCNIVKRIDARIQLLRKKGKYFLCLKSGHWTRSCNGNLRFTKCYGLHLTLICDKERQQVNNDGDQPSHKPRIRHQNEEMRGRF